MSATIERAFQKMGARVSISTEPIRRFTRPWRGGAEPRATLLLNVRRDKAGEYFTIQNDGTELTVLDVQPKDRHLLLMSRDATGKHKFLLGHDERHWFVAGVPESKPVSSVRDAKLALKPSEVILAENSIRFSKRDRRKNKARHRQGEWFFVVDANFVPPTKWTQPILRNEPISRGRGSKPHICEELYRSGGETVYVSRGYQSGITQEQYEALDKKVREGRNWQVMKRNMDVWVRGCVRHPDHATIKLVGWHRVCSNTEHLSQAMRNITFLD